MPGRRPPWSSIPARRPTTVKEFVDLAKKQPGGLNYGNAGIGSSVHLNTVIFMNGTGTQITSVPYKGQPPAILDLMADRIHVKFASIGLVAQHVQEKKIKALAVIGNQRSPCCPTCRPWRRPATPRPTSCPGTALPCRAACRSRWSTRSMPPSARRWAMRTCGRLLEAQALQPVEPMSPQQIAELMAKDTERYAKVIQDANIKLNE